MKSPTLLTVKDFGGNREFLLGWAAKRLPHVGPQGFGTDSVPVAVVKGTGANDARLLAVVVFNAFDAHAKSLQISCASDSPMWAHPETIRALLAIPFEQYDCFMVWMAIPHDNARAIKFNQGIEMKQYGPLPHIFGEGRHAVIMQMTRHKWARRWRKEGSDGQRFARHGRQGRRTASAA